MENSTNYKREEPNSFDTDNKNNQSTKPIFFELIASSYIIINESNMKNKVVSQIIKNINGYY